MEISVRLLARADVFLPVFRGQVNVYRVRLTCLADSKEKAPPRVKTFIIIAVTTVVAVGLASVYFVKVRGGNTVAEATIVRVEPVQVGDLIESVSAPGQVEPKTK